MSIVSLLQKAILSLIGIMILDANSKDAESDVRDFLRQSAVYRGNVRFFADETELIMAFVRTVSVRLCQLIHRKRHRLV